MNKSEVLITSVIRRPFETALKNEIMAGAYQKPVFTTGIECVFLAIECYDVRVTVDRSLIKTLSYSRVSIVRFGWRFYLFLEIYSLYSRPCLSNKGTSRTSPTIRSTKNTVPCRANSAIEMARGRIYCTADYRKDDSDHWLNRVLYR
jgi:hypothetical protein